MSSRMHPFLLGMGTGPAMSLPAHRISSASPLADEPNYPRSIRNGPAEVA